MMERGAAHRDVDAKLNLESEIVEQECSRQVCFEYGQLDGNLPVYEEIGIEPVVSKEMLEAIKWIAANRGRLRLLAEEVCERTSSRRAGPFEAASVNVEMAVLLKKAILGDVQAQFELGCAFDGKDKSLHNRATAQKWFTKAANQGHEESAQRVLATF